MYAKQQLKPLNHKKSAETPRPKETKEAKEVKPEMKVEAKQEVKKQEAVKPALAKKSSNGEAVAKVKYERSGQRSTKTIEHYDCDDFGL